MTEVADSTRPDTVAPDRETATATAAVTNVAVTNVAVTNVALEGADERMLPAKSSRPVRLLRGVVRTRVTGWILVAGIVAAWQIKANIAFDPTIQSPWLVAKEWVKEIKDGEMLNMLWISLRTMIIGNAIAVPIGVGLGFLMGRSRVVWGLFEPLIEIIRLTPVTAILPIYVLFLGLGDQFQIAVFLTAGLFPMVINSYAGARAVSKVLSETGLTYRLTWFQTQREIALPFAWPYIVVGLRQSVAHSLVLAVIIGMLAGNDGIGYYLFQAQEAFNVLRVLSVVLTVAVVGYAINAVFVVLERRVRRHRVGHVVD